LFNINDYMNRLSFLLKKNISPAPKSTQSMIPSNSHSPGEGAEGGGGAAADRRKQEQLSRLPNSTAAPPILLYCPSYPHCTWPVASTLNIKEYNSKFSSSLWT
jgi:hypothetical protein